LFRCPCCLSMPLYISPLLRWLPWHAHGRFHRFLQGRTLPRWPCRHDLSRLAGSLQDSLSVWAVGHTGHSFALRHLCCCLCSRSISAHVSSHALPSTSTTDSPPIASATIRLKKPTTRNGVAAITRILRHTSLVLVFTGFQPLNFIFQVDDSLPTLLEPQV